MNILDLPILSHILESGADDRVFDFLLLVGPLVIALVAALGRTLLTRAIAFAYIGVFVAHILYRSTTQLQSR